MDAALELFNRNGYDTMRTCKKGNSYQAANAQFEIVHDKTCRQADPERWATTQNNLAIAYSDRIRGERADNIEQAISAYGNHAHGTHVAGIAVEAHDTTAAGTSRIAGRAVTDRQGRYRIGGLTAGNPAGFHDPSGAGYRFLADWLLKVDAKNPQTAARMSTAYETWRRYDADRQGMIREQLERIALRVCGNHQPGRRAGSVPHPAPYLHIPAHREHPFWFNVNTDSG